MSSLIQAELFLVNKHNQPTFNINEVDFTKDIQIALPLQATFGTTDLSCLAELALGKCIETYLKEHSLKGVDTIFLRICKRAIDKIYIDDLSILISKKDTEDFTELLRKDNSHPINQSIPTQLAVGSCKLLTEILAFSSLYLKGFETQDPWLFSGSKSNKKL